MQMSSLQELIQLVLYFTLLKVSAYCVVRLNFTNRVMPAAPKKAKAGKKDSKKSANKKGLKGLQTISALLKSLRIQYDVKCKDEQSFALADIKNSIKEYEEKCEFLVKVRSLVAWLLYLTFLQDPWIYQKRKKNYTRDDFEDYIFEIAI